MPKINRDAAGVSNSSGGFNSAFAQVMGSNGDQEATGRQGFYNLYDRIDEEERRASAFDQQDISKDENQKDEREEMSTLDRIMYWSGKAAEAIPGISGWDGEFDWGNPIGSLIGFGANTLLSQPASVFSAAQSLYEGATGRNVRDADIEQGVLGEDLNSNQQVGATLSGLTDAAGLFFGGSREAGHALKNVITGSVDDAAESAVRYGLRQFAGDVASEGIEEGAQSIFEDIRNDQAPDLGKAVESAGWGALGGGLMGGGAFAVNSMLGRNAKKQQQNVASAQPTGANYFSFGSMPDTTRQADAQMAEFYEDDLKADNTAAGSTSYTAIPGGYDINPRQIDMGVRSLRNMYLADEDSRNAFVNSTANSANPIDRATADNWFNVLDDDQLSKAVTDAIEQGTVFEVAAKRDPKTKDSSLIKFNLRKVENGNAIRMNPAVYQMFGGDIDGDTWRVHSDQDQVETTRWASEYLMSPRALPDKKTGERTRYGASNLDMKYSGMSILRKGVGGNDVVVNDHAREALVKVLRRYQNSNNPSYYAITANNPLSYWTRLLDDSATEAANTGDIDSESVYALARMRQEVEQIAGHDTADRFTADLIQQIQIDTHMDVEVDAIVSSANKKVQDVNIQLADSGIKIAESRGSAGSAKTGLGLFDWWGKVTLPFSEKENPMLRANQNVQWQTSSVISSIHDPEYQLPAVEELVAWQMQIVEAGLSPLDALNTKFRVYVFDGMERSGLINPNGSAISDGGMSWPEFKDRFIEIYNGVAREYNQALKRQGYEGMFTPIGSVPKSEARRGQTQTIDRAVEDVIGHMPIREFFVITEGDSYFENMSLSDYVQAIADGDIDFNDILELDETSADAARELVRFHNSQNNARSSQVENTVRDLVNERVNNGIAIRYDENGDPVYDNRMMLAFEQYANAVRSAIGLKAAAYFGFSDTERMMRSVWGRYLFSNDPDVVIHAIGSLSAAYKYRYYIEARMRIARLREDLGHTTDEQARAHLSEQILNTVEHYKTALSNLYNISELDRQIVSQILSTDDDANVNDSLLRAMIDPSYDSWASLNKRWDEHWGPVTGDQMIHQSLLSNMMRNNEGDIGEGEIALRMKDTKRYTSTMKKYSLLGAKKIWARVNRLAESVTHVSVEDALNRIIRDNVRSQNLDIKAASICDSIFVMHDVAAKGTSPSSAGADYLQQASARDAVEDFIHKLTGQSLGAMTADDYRQSSSLLCQMLSDGSVCVQVDDMETGAYGMVDRQAVFDAVGRVVMPGDTPSLNDYDALFSAYPQLVTMVTPRTYDVVQSGKSSSVVESMDSTLDTVVSDYINSKDGTNMAAVRVESSKTTALLANSPKFNLIILGTVAARAKRKYGSFSNLTARPHLFSKEVKRAYRDWAKIIYKMAVSGDGEIVRSYLRASEIGYSKSFSNDMRDMLDMARAISVTMSGTMNSANRQFVNQAARLGYSNLIINQLNNALNLVDDQRFDKLEMQKPSPHTSSDIYRRILDTMLAINSESNITYRDVDYLDANVVADMRSKYIADHPNDPNAGTTFDTTLENVRNSQIVSLENASPDSSVITYEQITSGDAADLYKKIKHIATSGEYGMFSESDIPQEADLSDLMTRQENGDMAAHRRLIAIRSKWNSLVLDRVLRDYAIENGTEVTTSGMYPLHQAYDILYDMVDQVRCSNPVIVNDDLLADIEMPDLDFSDPLITSVIANSQSISESSGNSTQSGIEGGGYQRLLSFGGLNSSSFGIGSRHAADTVDMTLNDLLAIIQQRLGPNDFINPYLHCRFQLRGNNGQIITTVDNATVESVTEVMNQYGDMTVQVFPLDRSAHGLGANTQTGIDVSGNDFVYLNQMLMDFVYKMSEGHVFKKKKALNIFDEVVRELGTDRSISDQRFALISDSMTDDEIISSLRRDMGAFRKKVATLYYNEFKAEQLDGDFGRYDAYILAQFTTPFVELRNADGSVTINMSADAIYCSSDFAALKAQLAASGVKWSDITSIRPVPMSVSSIMKRMEAYVGVNVRRMRDNNERPTRGDYSTWCEQSLTDWSFMHRDENLVKDLLCGMTPIPSHNMTNMPVAGMPNQMMNLMRIHGEMPRMGSKMDMDTEPMIEFFGKERFEKIMSAKGIYSDSDGNNMFGNILVSYSDIDTDITNANDNRIRTMGGRYLANSTVGNLAALGMRDLGQVPQGPYVNGVMVITDDRDRMARDIRKAYQNNLYLIVPSDSDTRSLVDSASGNINLHAIGNNINVGGIEFDVYSFDSMNLMNQMGDKSPRTYLRKGDRDEIAIMTGVAGAVTSADAGQLIHPESADRVKIRMEGDMKIPMDELFPGMMYAPEPVDKSDLKHFADAFEAWVREVNGGQRADDVYAFQPPKYPRGREMSNEAIIMAVRGYLNQASTFNHGDSVLRTDNVSTGDCIWFAKVHTLDGRIVYSPVIINTGQSMTSMRGLRPSSMNNVDADNIIIRWEGTITPRQAEGIKSVFDTVAWKAYETVASRKMLREWPSLAFNMMGRKISDIVFNLNTLKSRTIEQKEAVIRNNLFWGSRLRQMSLFFKYDPVSKKFVLGNDLFRKDIDDRTLMNVVNPRINMTHWDIAYGRLRLFDDERMNTIMRSVFMKCINQDVPPVVALGNIVINQISGDTEPGDALMFMEPSAILGDLHQPEILALYHAMDPKFCPDPYDISGKGDEGPTIFDNDGNMAYEMNGETVYRVTIIQPMKYKMDSTMIGVPAHQGAFSEQQRINRAVLNGFQETDLDHVTDMFSVRTGDYRQWEQGGERSRFEGTRTRPVNFNEDAFLYTGNGYRASLHAKALTDMNREGQVTFWQHLDIVDPTDGNEAIPYSDNRVRGKLDQLKEALGDENATDRKLMALFKLATGYTYNDGDGSREIPYQQFVYGIDKIIHNLNGNGYPIKGGQNPNDERIAIPIGPREIQEWLFNTPAVQRNFGRDRDRWDKAARVEFDKSLESLATVHPRRKREAIMRMMGYVARQHDIPFSLDYVVGYYTTYDVANANNEFLDLYATATEGPDMAARWREGTYGPEGTDKMLQDFAELEQSHQYDKLASQSAPSGYKAIWLGTRNTGFRRILSNAVTISRTNSVMTPLLGPSAFVQRKAGSGLMKAMLFLDSKGVPMMGGKMRNSILFERDGEPQVMLKQIARDRNLQRVWAELNELQLSGSDLAAVRNANTPEDIMQILSNVRNQQGRIGTISQKVFKMSTWSGVGASWQIENFFNYAASRLDPEKSPWYFERSDDTGKTNFELQMESDPIGLLVDLTTGRSRHGNPDLLVGLQARNFALESDLAQQEAGRLILHEMLVKHPVIEALLATNVMKFPTYAFNVAGWYTSFVFPTSSLRYWYTDILIKSAENDGMIKNLIQGATGVDISKLHLERTQVFESMHQAALNDVMRLGVVSIAGVIAAMPFEPPEDEDKMGNLNEWTIFGVRLDQVWWLQDILGPSLAIAATFKSAMIGKLRLDIIPNWMGRAMANNPLLRAADVVSALFDEQSSPLNGMVSEDDEYKGGNPTAIEIWQADIATYAMNWASQFLLPSVVRELYTTTGDQYEHSYKRVYATDEFGNIIYDEDGSPMTVETTYMDARIRQLTRYNPFLALLMNTFGDSETGYFRSQMPRTVYYESAQLESMEYYSLYTIDPETGQEVPKPVEERRAIAYEILATLETMTPEQMRDTGFMIDYETRVYVSKMLYDLRAYNQTLYNSWVQETGMDANVVGDGNFQLGMQRISRIKEAYYADYNHINDLYDKLWDDAIASGPQKYNRYQTTYQQDQWGNWYATGFRPSILNIGTPGFNTAPGTLSDPGGTMGWAGDWDTPSAVIPGASTGERALIPVDSVYVDKPSIESWADDGSGGYSDIWQDSLGDLAAVTGFDSDSDDDGYPTGYRYGYSRRSGGGGGGGGYTPNIYSRMPSVNMPYASTMYAERVYAPNYDYLRPNFETKGSREAYKRSDI